MCRKGELYECFFLPIGGECRTVLNIGFLVLCSTSLNELWEQFLSCE